MLSLHHMPSHWVSSLPFTVHSFQMVSSIGDLSMLKRFAPYCEATGNGIRTLTFRPSVSIFFPCGQKDEVTATSSQNKVLLYIGTAVPYSKGHSFLYSTVGSLKYF